MDLNFSQDKMTELKNEAELVKDAPREAMQALKNGSADLMPSMGITPSREKFLYFTPPVETFAISFFVRDDTQDIRGAQDLAGQRVAVVEPNIAVRLLKDRKNIDTTEICLSVFGRGADCRRAWQEVQPAFDVFRGLVELGFWFHRHSYSNKYAV